VIGLAFLPRGSVLPVITLHNVWILIFTILMDGPAASLTTFSAMVCLRASLTFLLFSVFLFPRCGCCFRSQFLKSTLRLGGALHLFLNVRPLGVPTTTKSLVCFFHRLFSTVGPLWPHPLHCAGKAWWVIHLQVTANFFRDPLSPWVHFFGCWRWPMARCRCQISVVQFSDSFHWGLFFRDILMLHYWLHFFQVGLKLWPLSSLQSNHFWPSPLPVGVPTFLPFL
jgi:hypothetical protein